jgi:hypothetical protein
MYIIGSRVSGLQPHSASKLCHAVNKIFSKISLKIIREMALHA